MHQIHNKTLSAAVIAALGLSLAACGSSGSSSSSSSPASNDGAQVSEDNADRLIEVSFTPPKALGELTESLAETALGTLGAMPAAKGASTAQDDDSLIPESLRSKLAHHAAGARATENCDDGGTITMTEHDPDNNGQDEGDSVEIHFASCSADGTTINGGVNLAIRALSHTSAGGTVGVDYVLDALEVREDGDVLKMDGNASFDLCYDSSHEDIVVSSSGLTFTFNGSAISFASFRMQEVFYAASKSWTNDLDFVASGSLLGGQLTAVTDPVMYGEDAVSGNPLRGVITFTGQQGSYVSLDAGTGDPDTVMKAVNGVSQVVNWSDLDL